MLGGVPVQQVLFTVFQSILQVFLLCFAGFALSFKGIVDKPTSKVLNHINVALFTPALLFSKVAFFLSPAKLRQLWIIPIFFVLVTTLSAVIAFGLARAFRLKRSQVNFATAASMFMNSNSLPVALMQSLATTVPNLKWGPDDTVDAMFGRSLTYLVVFSTLGMILRWSYGVRLLSKVNEPDSDAAAPSTYRDNDVTNSQHGLSHRPTTRLVNYDTEADVDRPQQKNSWRTRLPRSPFQPRLTPLSRRHSHPRSYLHTHLPAVPTSLGDQSESDDSDELDTTEGESEENLLLRSETTESGFSTEEPSDATAQPMPRWHQVPVSFWTRLYKMLTGLSPPLVASLLAIVVVVVPPFQQLLQSTVMTPFKGALDNAGGCSVPLTLIVLGGWFWDGESKPKSKSGQPQAKSKGKEPHLRDNAISTLVGGHQAHASQHVAVSKLQEPSRNSSTTSLSSVLGAFGDVLLARIALGATIRSQWRSGTNVVDETEADLSDVERGRLATHTETADDDNLHPRLRKESVLKKDAHARPSPAPDLVSPKSAGNPPGETLAVVLSLLARMIIVPILVTPLMVLVSRLGWGGEVFEDPVFIVSSMLLVSSPPALTLAQISHRPKPTPGAQADADVPSPFERLLSRTVFWAYLALTPPVTIASVMVGLFMVGA